MTKIDLHDFRLALTAADWFERLENHEVDEMERHCYVRWLNQSPAHAEAMRFMRQFSDSLRRAKRDGFSLETPDDIALTPRRQQ